MDTQQWPIFIPFCALSDNQLHYLHECVPGDSPDPLEVLCALEAEALRAGHRTVHEYLAVAI